jgi:hypothetical protein
LKDNLKNWLSPNQNAEDMTLDPLYETYYFPKPKICLVCGRDKAVSGLHSICRNRIIVPLCSNCSFNYNFHGISILNKIKPKELIYNLIKYKFFHWFSSPSLLEIYADLQEFKAWEIKMKRIMKSLSITV